MSEPAKTYLLFAGARYYPRGGIKDYVGSFDTLGEAEEAWLKASRPMVYPNGVRYYPLEWYQIVDHQTMEVVCEGE